MDKNPLSYKTIQQSRQAFRQVSREGFNMYDEPGTYWFKPIFYFYRSTEISEDSFIGTEGLLHPSWLESNAEIYAKDKRGANEIRKTKHENLNFASSAYNYLMRNDDEYRARLLRRFIELLSNISTQSPWYFKAVSGLDKATNHSEEFKSGKFVSDERRQIVFTMLEDAVDDRVGTLLDLYRTACYSWRSKREIVPANLRKFDMGIYIFGDMIQDNASDIRSTQIKRGESINYEPSDSRFFIRDGAQLNSPFTAMSGKNTDIAHQNTIYLEFQNCEINLSSTQIGDSMDNAEGTSHVYTLTIDYDECYVNRVNTAIKAIIGDAILSDIYAPKDDIESFGEVQDNDKSSIGRDRSEADYKDTRDLDSRSLRQSRRNLGDQISNTIAGIPSKLALNAVSYGVGAVKKYVLQPATKFLFGNLYHGSLLTGAEMLLSGNIAGVVREVKSAVGNESSRGATGKLYEKPKQEQQSMVVHKLFEAPVKPSTPTTLGRLYERNTMRNL